MLLSFRFLKSMCLLSGLCTLSFAAFSLESQEEKPFELSAKMLKEANINTAACTDEEVESFLASKNKTFEDVSRVELECSDLTAVPPWVYRCSHIKGLGLFRNKITELPVWIGSFSHLKGMCLAENQLTELPEEMVQLEKLRSLYLNNNKFSVLPDCVTNLSSLEILELDGNQLESLPSSIQNLQSLGSISLNRNRFQFAKYFQP